MSPTSNRRPSAAMSATLWVKLIADRIDIVFSSTRPTPCSCAYSTSGPNRFHRRVRGLLPGETARSTGGETNRGGADLRRGVDRSLERGQHAFPSATVVHRAATTRDELRPQAGRPDRLDRLVPALTGHGRRQYPEAVRSDAAQHRQRLPERTVGRRREADTERGPAVHIRDRGRVLHESSCRRAGDNAEIVVQTECSKCLMRRIVSLSYRGSHTPSAGSAPTERQPMTSTTDPGIRDDAVSRWSPSTSTTQRDPPFRAHRRRPVESDLPGTGRRRRPVGPAPPTPGDGALTRPRRPPRGGGARAPAQHPGAGPGRRRHL